MIKTPAPREKMRYAELVTWLREEGYSIFDIRRMVDKNVIKAQYIPLVGKHAYYSATQVKEALDGNRQEENST